MDYIEGGDVQRSEVTISGTRCDEWPAMARGSWSCLGCFGKPAHDAHVIVGVTARSTGGPMKALPLRCLSRWPRRLLTLASTSTCARLAAGASASGSTDKHGRTDHRMAFRVSPAQTVLWE